MYTALLVVLSWLWFSVRRQDAAGYMQLTARYLAGMVTSVLVIGGSAALPADARVVVWAILLVGWLAGALTIERFGLFTIIVLGEVIVGVVTGLSEVERTLRTTVTGIVGRMIGAVALIGLIVTMRTLADYQRLLSIYRPLSAGIGMGVVAVMLVGWWRPDPWALALAVVGVLSVVWSVGVDRWLRLPNPSDAQPGGQ